MSKGFLEYNKFVPHSGIEFLVKTPSGIRKAVLTRGGYRYIDCTHPLQNCCLSSIDILEWRYVDEKYMNELYFTPNHYARQKDGEQILSTIKKPSVFKRIISFLKEKL